MRLAAFALAALGLAAQTPRPAPFDEAFFAGDRRLVLQACAERLRTLKPKDAKHLAESGRACLAALDKAKAEAAFRDAETRESKDGEILRLIASAWLQHGYKTEALEGYGKILQRDPKNKEALAQAGVDLAEMGMMHEADRYMGAYTALEKDGWREFLRFGRACLVAGQRKAAALWFARAVALKADEEEVFLEISRAFTETQAGL